MKNITKHGEKRLRKRFGLSKQAIDKSFGVALMEGRKQGEFKGQFRKYLDDKAAFYRAMPIIYGHNIYWVKNSSLITAYQVPAKYKKYL